METAGKYAGETCKMFITQYYSEFLNSSFKLREKGEEGCFDRLSNRRKGEERKREEKGKIAILATLPLNKYSLFLLEKCRSFYIFENYSFSILK
jgi:hypothetical protein